MSDHLDGERTVSPVASTRKPWLTKRRQVMLIAGGMTAVIAFVFWKDPGHKKEEEQPRAPAQGISQVVPYTPAPPAPMPAVMQAPPPPPQPAPAPSPQPLPAPQPIFAPAAAPAPAQKQKPPRMLSFATETQPRSEGGPAATGHSDQTRVSYKAAQIVGGKAGPALDRDLVLMPGIIHCILDTAIDSTLPGPLMCHLDKPVISTGNVMLMEAGTQIIGNYTNEVKQGQGRLMAVSATAYTPNGVPVPLGGPFADGLGRTGLDGEVDNHLFQRFGGAVLLSLAESALGIAQSSVSKGGNSYVSFSSGGVGTLAQEVLRNTINIPPTITKHQGDEVSIWVLQPIDFSAAYKLRTRE